MKIQTDFCGSVIFFDSNDLYFLFEQVPVFIEFDTLIIWLILFLIVPLDDHVARTLYK